MIQSRFILPLLQRHAADAAWLYTQFDFDRASSLVDFERLHLYQRIFVAHLDGVLAADVIGGQLAYDQLARWKGSGELFVYLYLALHLEDDRLFAAAWDFLRAHPEPHYLDSAAAVLLWLPMKKAISALERLMASGTALAVQVGLNAYGLRRELPALDILALFRHKSSALRAEACRYAGRLRRFDCIPQLLCALGDLDRQLREQAAIALLLCNEAEAALSELYAALQYYAGLVEAGEGSAAIRAEGRAQYLARLLGHALPFPCADAVLERLLAEVPPYLSLLTLAHHGNPAHEDVLISFMRERAPLYKRRALWAMSFMLGINPETEGLLAENPSLSADWPAAPGLDQDAGLPEPDVERVAQWWKRRKTQYGTPLHPYLSGQAMQTQNLHAIKALLTDGMQAQRFAASLHSVRLDRNAPWVDTRAPLALQRRLWKNLDYHG